ncbi:MAG TPA: hypothetical protein VF365_06365 [Candidatus Limnocylindria bacterium]
MTHSDPRQGTDPGIEHEEHHEVGRHTGIDEPIHNGPGGIASDVEANETRPAGPDLRAEDAAARGFDPETPMPASETEDGPD